MSSIVPKRTSASFVSFIIGCLRSYPRVRHLSYRPPCTLDRWNGHHSEFGNLYHRATLSSTALARTHLPVVDKEEASSPAFYRTCSLTTYADPHQWIGMTLIIVSDVLLVLLCGAIITLILTKLSHITTLTGKLLG